MSLRVHKENSRLSERIERAIPQLGSDRKPRLIFQPKIVEDGGTVRVEIVIAMRLDAAVTSRETTLEIFDEGTREAMEATIKLFEKKGGEA